MKNSSEDRALSPKDAARTERGSQFPAIGEWFWIEVEADERKAKGSKGSVARKELVCVERVRSNHVVVGGIENGNHWRSIWQIRHEDWLKETQPAPEWESVIGERMAALRLQMDDAVKALRNEAVAKNAIVDGGAAPPTFSETDAMLPAVRVVDPAKQKVDFLALKERTVVVKKEVDELAKAYAGQATALQFSQKFKMEQTVRELACLNERIFVLEVYSGMQEGIVQIADGQAAPDTEKIAVRQSLLFMDEETLINYDGGGMDYANIEAFDEWIVTPENLNRILPEPRGIVAFRVRRKDKKYGSVNDWAGALLHAKWNWWNRETYLVIRNGEKVYRIASEVDFSPRLFPLRDEFEGAFAGDSGFGRKAKEVTPRDFEYDDTVEALMEKLRAYNKITILLQGLLDRSDVFQPIAPANLSTATDFANTLNLIRDEEGGLPLTQESFTEYRDRLNRSIKRGDWVYISYPEPEPVGNGWGQNSRPRVLMVDRIRVGRATDITRVPEYDTYYKRDTSSVVEHPDEIEGRMGVEVSWAWGTRTGFKNKDWGEWGEWPVDRRRRQWIPLEGVFALEGYQLGDFKVFLCDRTQKGQYLKWAGPLLAGEQYKQGKMEFDALQTDNPKFSKK